jgi:predicted CXXCH cytochrome family protein
LAFLIRAISHSAEGREIVRASHVEGNRLTIGRDPACDIHLTDLAVALRHVTVERIAGRLAVEAEAGLSVELNGRKVRTGTIEAAVGGDMLIASHLLRFMPTPAGSDEIAIDIERVTEGEVKLDKSSERLFSLASVLPTRRAGAWAMFLVVLGVCLVWPIQTYRQHRAEQQRAVQYASFQADELWSSGHLSAAHARLRHDCGACHVKAFESVRDAACVACHKDIHDHADPLRMARARPDLGGWARFQLAVKQRLNLPPGRCIDCHTEHEGPQTMPPTPQHFCSDCHADLKGRLPDTRIGNAGDFGSAHPQFKPVVIAGWNGPRPMLARASLDARPREDSGLKFPHAMHLSTTNGVAQMTRRLAARYGFGQALQCRDCHVPTPDGVRFQPVSMEENCAMCHSLAFDRVGGTLRTLRHGQPDQVVADLREYYRGRALPAPPNFSAFARRRPGAGIEFSERAHFAAGAARPGRAEQAIRAVFSPGGACYDCHRVLAPPPGSLDFRIAPVAFPVRYLHKGWFDHRPHATESCQSCHGAERSQAAADLLIPGVDSCRTCHGGERTSKPVASSCAMCHDYHMDRGAPAMILRQRVRGKMRDVKVAQAETARLLASSRSGNAPAAPR